MPTRARTLLAASVLLATSLLGVAFAQIEPRARTFIEGMHAMFDTDVSTLDQTAVMTTFMPDGTDMAMTIRTVIDYVNRRAATFTEVMPGMESRMLIKDGQATMTMTGMPMALPVPPDAAAELEALFDPPVWPGFKDGDVATYDGQVSYGDLLSGEQVSYTTKHVMGGQETDYTTRFVFASGGAVLGYVIESPGNLPIMMVLAEPASSGHLAGLDASIYLQEGGNWNLSSTMEFVEYQVNEPLDESLFE